MSDYSEWTHDYSTHEWEDGHQDYESEIDDLQDAAESGDYDSDYD